MPVGTPLRVTILVASIALAAAAFFVTDSRNDDEVSREDETRTGASTTVSDEVESGGTTSVYRLGASAYFPQGTNPPIGSGLPGARRGLSIALEDARYEGDTVTAFGVFIEGEPECGLLSGPGGRKIPVSDAEMELADDAFSYTATPDGNDTSDDLTVHCELSRRPADMDEARVVTR